MKAPHSKADRMAGCIRVCFRETTAGEADGSTGGRSCLLKGGNWDGLPRNAFYHGLEEALGACGGITQGRRPVKTRLEPAVCFRRNAYAPLREEHRDGEDVGEIQGSSGYSQRAFVTWKGLDVAWEMSSIDVCVEAEKGVCLGRRAAIDSKAGCWCFAGEHCPGDQACLCKDSVSE